MLSAVDLFAGAGGLSLGFQRAGFRLTGFAESDAKHRETHKWNFPGCAVVGTDVASLSGDEVLQRVGRPNLLIGGPPCQGFSVGGHQHRDDPRNQLLLHFGRMVTEVEPDVFVMENVVGLNGERYLPIRKQFRRMVERAGFDILVDGNPLQAQHYGVPQRRKRLFWVGVRRSLNLTIQWPPPTEQPSNVRDAIGDLPNVNCKAYDGPLNTSNSYADLMATSSWGEWVFGERLEEPSRAISGFRHTAHSSIVRARFARVKPGERDAISRFLRLDWDGVAPTLRAGTTSSKGSFMAPRPIHPTHDRCITVREAARLHSIPDWFQLWPTAWYGHMQIGNSVPPLLAFAVGCAIANALE